jgi:hypothetical protein
MAKKRRPFRRRKPVLDYRKLFVIATEGRKTEPDYFRLFNSKEATIRLRVLPSKHRTSPRHVLERAEAAVKKEQLKKTDETWLVIDIDQWPLDQLEEVFAGCQFSGFSLAVSNPKFEYWLLLHFEDGGAVESSRACSEKLRHYLPDYDKGNLAAHKLYSKIPDAIRRAKEKDRPPCKKWSEQNGSTVYLLVEKLFVDTSCLPKE